MNEQSNTMEDSTVFVSQPHANDVLCGRGGKANNHPGNVCFRDLVRQRRPTYVAVRSKKEKGLISEGIVNEIRRLNPPGRFIIYDGKIKQWIEISERKAKRKTAQALREKTPADRKRLSDVARMQAGTEARSGTGNRSPWQHSMENVMDKFSSAFNCCGANPNATDFVAASPPLKKSYDASAGRPIPVPTVTPQKPDILGYSFGDASRSVTTEELTHISSVGGSAGIDEMFGACDSICDCPDNYCCCYDDFYMDEDSNERKVAAPIISVDEDELMRQEIITPPSRNMHGNVCHGLEDFFAAKGDFEPLFEIDMDDDALQADTVHSTNF